MGIIKKNVIETKIRCLINSTNLLETVYDVQTKDFNVTFKGGRVYQYKNVDPKVYNQFELSESHGKSFNQFFKTAPSTRLPDVDVTGILNEISKIV